MSDDPYESWLEWISERAAILQFDAGIPPAEAWARAVEMRVDYVAGMRPVPEQAGQA